MGAVLTWFFVRGKGQAAGPIQAGGKVGIEILPGEATYGRYAGITPGAITEGLKGNQAKVTITNSSSKRVTQPGGAVDTAPSAYTFQLVVSIACGATGLLNSTGPIPVAASATITGTYIFDIPWDITGPATATATLKTTDGSVILAGPSAVNFNIAAVPVTPGGGINW